MHEIYYRDKNLGLGQKLDNKVKRQKLHDLCHR